jgi:hypothetical protein
METFAEKARSTRVILQQKKDEVVAVGRRLTGTAHDEAAGWRQYLKLRAIDLGLKVRRFPWAVEERVLDGVQGVVGRADQALKARLEALREAPFADYDALSAKDIVARLEGLPPEQVHAVWEFERTHKARATILRAVEEHLAV